MLNVKATVAPWLVLILALGAQSALGLSEDRVLLVWNSKNAESVAVRDAYLAARPTVLELDLDHASLGPGALTRNQYNNRVRDPLLAYLSGTDDAGVPLAQRVVAIATTRGLPARVNGPGEFTLASQRASLESEIALIWQNLDGPGEGALPFRYSGIVDNPYHRIIGLPIETFDRSNITTIAPFEDVFFSGAGAVWTAPSLTPGDIYLACRLDGGSLEDTLALIGRSSDAPSMTVRVDCVQALFDEYPASAREQLDDQGLPPVFPSDPDFENAASVLRSIDISTTHDETTDFITGSDLPSDAPLLVLGTYGENHDLDGAGDDPPGRGTYLQTYDPHPAGVLVTYESFSGNCLIDGTQRQNQACATDWIAGGGSFAIPTVAEPFAFPVADLETFTRNFYVEGLSFAEAVYSAVPGLSWQNTPVGDPLARVTLAPPGSPADLSGDRRVDATDLAILIAAWGSADADLNGDGDTGASDLAALIAAWGPAPECP